MNRGNHESKNLTRMYGFEGEVKHKLDVKCYELFCQMFCYLPLCTVINKTVMVCHGGLFSTEVTLADIKKVNRVRVEVPDNGIMCELLWSDPGDAPGRGLSKRGCGITYGPDVAERFLKANGLKLLVRAHEVKPEGYEW
jgi:serine/threonine-protein phosphatase 5